jgi:hypothetical protein
MAGNICLVVFLALLFSVASWAVGPVDHAKASVSAISLSQSPNELTGKTYDVYKVLATNPGVYANTIAYLANNISSNRVTQLVYSDAYSTELPVYEVYGYVYLVYTGDINDWDYINTGTQIYVYSTGGSKIAGYQGTEVPIPKYTSPGGGGGGGAAQPQPTTTTTTETATITQTGNTATVTPNVAAITSQLATGAINQVTLAVPSTVTATALTVQMPSGLLQALASTPVPVQVQAAGVTVTLPATLFSTPAAQNAAQALNATLNLMISEVTSVMSPQVQNAVNSQPNANAYTAPVAVYQFSLEVVQPGQVAQPVTSFGGGQAQVSVAYNQAQVPPGLQEWRLNFYRVAGNILTPVLTWIDSINNIARMSLSHFSEYALIGYNKSFADVSGHWAQGTVELLASKHIISGVDANNFAPNRNITRAEFAALLQKMLGLTAKTGQAAFKDVQAGTWYYDAVQAAYQAGLVKGRSAGVFDPQANITRQEMAAMIVRTLNYLGVTTSLSQDQASATLGQFADQASIAPWAREAAAVAATKGIISGRSGGNFAPTANATRAESATMLYNLIRSAGLLK